MNIKIKSTILIFAIILGLGLLFALFGGDSVNTSGVEYGPDLKNSLYIIENQPVRLVKGLSAIETSPGSASKIITKYFGNEAYGDFNGDGTEDVVFLLTQDGGGSGTFYYVAAAIKTNDGYLGTNAVFLGDRIAPQTTEFRDGEIIVNFAERMPGESMTVRPSLGVSKYLKIEDGRLVEVLK